MNSVDFYVDNIKCNGCVNNIKEALLQMDGVIEVKVSLEEGKVEVGYEGENRKSMYVQTLARMGYFEKENTSSLSDHTIHQL
jgi:copper chaperone